MARVLGSFTTLKKFKYYFWAHQNIRLIGFTAAITGIGMAAILFTQAATPSVDVETEGGARTGSASILSGDTTASGGEYVKFGNSGAGGDVMLRLMAPAWRPMATDRDEAVAKAAALTKSEKFKEIFQGTYRYFDTTKSEWAFKQLNPKVIPPSSGAKVYKYTLGPYVTNTYVPCDLIPTTHLQYANYVVNTPSCMTESRIPTDLNELIISGKITYDEWRKAIAQAKYNDPNNPSKPGCPADPIGDSSLKSIYACAFENNFLIYPNSTPWVTYMRESLIPKAINCGTGCQFDGVFADSVGSNPGEDPPGYLNHVPQKPSDANSLPTASDPKHSTATWLMASRESLVVREAKLRELGKVLTLNGLEKGTDYWNGCTDFTKIKDGSCNISTTPESTRKLLVPGLHGAMSEVIFRGAGGGINLWDNSTYLDSWLKDVEMIRDVQRRDIKGYWWTKCWTGTDYSCNDEDPALVTQWKRFVISSYLLGAGDKSYMNFDTKREDNDSAQYFTEYDHALTLGKTTNSNSYTQIGSSGVYSRTFSNGIVLVNPLPFKASPDNSRTVTIPTGTYKKFDGTVLTNISSIDLTPHTGEILVRQ